MVSRHRHKEGGFMDRFMSITLKIQMKLQNSHHLFKTNIRGNRMLDNFLSVQYTHTHIHICIYVYMCIYIYIHRQNSVVEHLPRMYTALGQSLRSKDRAAKQREEKEKHIQVTDLSPGIQWRTGHTEDHLRHSVLRLRRMRLLQTHSQQCGRESE